VGLCYATLVAMGLQQEWGTHIFVVSWAAARLSFEAITKYTGSNPDPSLWMPPSA